jgi:hypothetical protein
MDRLAGDGLSILFCFGFLFSYRSTSKKMGCCVRDVLASDSLLPIRLRPRKKRGGENGFVWGEAGIETARPSSDGKAPQRAKDTEEKEKKREPQSTPMSGVRQLILFLNGAQETVDVPTSRRYALPDGALAATAVAFRRVPVCGFPYVRSPRALAYGHDNDGDYERGDADDEETSREECPVQTIPLAAIVERPAADGASTTVRVTKGDAVFEGDLVSVDAGSVTVSPSRDVMQTIADYDRMTIERRDRPVRVVGGGPASNAAAGAVDVVAYARDDLWWEPSYAVYLGGGDDPEDALHDPSGCGDAVIADVRAVADIANATGAPVEAASAWVVPVRVPLPPRTPPVRAVATAARSLRAAAAPVPAPTMMAAAAAAAAPVQSFSVPGEAAFGDAMPRDEGAMVAAVAPSDVAFGGDDDRGAVEESAVSARYPLGRLFLGRGARVALPLFATGPPADQEAVVFYALPSAPSPQSGGGGSAALRGFRFIADRFLPAGRAAVFDHRMAFVGMTSMRDAVAGEPVDLVLGPSTEVAIESRADVRSTYTPVAGLRQEEENGHEQVSGTAPIESAGGGPRQVLVRVVDAIAIRGTVRSAAPAPTTIVLSYRVPPGGVVESSDPPPERVRRGALEWTLVAPRGRTDFAIDLSVYRGERLLAREASL